MTLQISFSAGKYIEAGTDEAGRGCLAGPVIAAAVILPTSFQSELIRDSKQLNEAERLAAREKIIANALHYYIASASALEIDEINILNASILAMHRALEGLAQQPELILVDGNRFKPYNYLPYECVIKGDDKFLSIAAASILAKTERDRIMKELHLQYPFYGWDTNVGYPTIYHRRAVLEHGFSPHHRKIFKVRL